MATQLALDLVHSKKSLDPGALKITDEVLSEFRPQPPKYKWIESQRNMGYNIKTATSEHIDNASDARCNRVNIIFRGELRSRVKEIIIMDDGFGMDFETLLNSFEFGAVRERQTYECGKFGQGGSLGSLSYAARKKPGREIKKVFHS